MSDALRVVKIGGSLLNGHNPAERLRAWINQQDCGKLIVIVGGGELVDALRRLDKAKPLGEERAHWLAIDLMKFNARVVATWLELPVVEGRTETLRDALRQDIRVVVYDVRQFLRDEEPGLKGARLPIGWATTSDAISARIAGALGASLTLYKSSPPPTPTDDWSELAKVGYVDRAFPAVAAELSSVDWRVLPPLGAG